MRHKQQQQQRRRQEVVLVGAAVALVAVAVVRLRVGAVAGTTVGTSTSVGLMWRRWGREA